MLKEKLDSVFEMSEHSSTTLLSSNRMRNLHSHLKTSRSSSLDDLDLRNAMVPLMTLLASYTADANHIT